MAIINYFSSRITPSRILCSAVVSEIMPTIQGKVVEIGASTTGFNKKYAVNAKEYLLTNIVISDSVSYLNAMDMELEDNSIDTIISINMLEHVTDPNRVINEICRTLKPGGKIFLIVPWMYPFHASPDDYYRFSRSTLIIMLSDLQILRLEALGNFWSAISLFIQLNGPIAKTSRRFNSVIKILLYLPISSFGFLFYIFSRFKRNNDNFTILHCVVAKKPL